MMSTYFCSCRNESERWNRSPSKSHPDSQHDIHRLVFAHLAQLRFPIGLELHNNSFVPPFESSDYVIAVIVIGRKLAIRNKLDYRSFCHYPQPDLMLNTPVY